ncbi:MAG TPA: hypothetical protein PKD64_13520 [Pirellulaceae bacterium]|nr:hypothetical protein [Pirellulaceae bacterium]HMO93204.1 hypothetical protein [Pirellulaceae bacterium]HMP70035.1 hypothetical protein [Pirellulaceae bacterium]
MFRWLSKSNRKIFYSDHFAFTQDALDNTLCEIVSKLANSHELIFLLTHFPATFEQYQTLLEERSMDYAIARDSIDWTTNLATLRGTDANIRLSLVQTFMSGICGVEVQQGRDFDISVIILERHPLYEMDEQLKRYVKKIPCRAKVGYYLSFDQPVMNYAIGAGLRVLMQQFGMSNHSLVTSELICRHVRRRLLKYQSTHSSRMPTDSPLEWYQVNGE